MRYKVRRIVLSRPNDDEGDKHADRKGDKPDSSEPLCPTVSSSLVKLPLKFSCLYLSQFGTGFSLLRERKSRGFIYLTDNIRDSCAI